MKKTFFSDLLDFDTYANVDNEKWPSLKLVFDNLRCYPILAIFGALINILHSSPDILSVIAFYFLFIIFILLFMATIAQTSVLLTVLAIGIFSTYLVGDIVLKRAAANRKLFKWIFYLVSILLLCISIISATAIFKIMMAIKMK